MSAAATKDEIAFDARLDALASVAAMFPWPLPRMRTEAECHEFVRLVDAVLVAVARGRGALDIAIGEDLEALGTGDGVLRLSFSGIADYARERLGIPASTAQKMVRLARELRDRPLLRAAVRAGEVTVRQAEAVLPVARGEEEAEWVARARKERVRALKAAVKEVTAQEGDEDDPWVCIRLDIAPEFQPVVAEAMELSRRILGATSLEGHRAAGMCEEYLGAHPPSEAAEASVRLLSTPAAEFLDPVKEWLEKETSQWAFLGQPDPVAAPDRVPEPETDTHRLDERLQRLAGMRDRWDEVFGHLAMIFRATKGWHLLGFAAFEHYCTERLGMSAQAVAQRATLERRLYDLPLLREAMRDGRLSYEKARLIARFADEESIAGWIDRARGMTCVELRRRLRQTEEAQMCARGEFAVWVPRSMVGLFTLAFAAARKEAGRPLSPGECFARIAAHFVEVWKPILTLRKTVQNDVLRRDNWLCQVPGCSRAAAQVHHIEFRSAGGSDDPSNLVSLCAAHHLQGVHKGYLRVRGKAPDQLTWEIGSRPARDEREVA